MPDHLARRLGTLVAWCSTAAIGAATATGAAVASSYALCAVGLFALGGGALAAYRTVQTAEERTDRAILERLQHPAAPEPAALAADLGLRPAAVKLSLHRLTASGPLPSPATPPGPAR
ncbi:hypothetical protein AB0F92_37910 [Kitasatospora aureofaciens]|uniref:hypothetical protein n=1 Tax=Kitasatospora aureofaciens TaxID=1894 RepID=UPI00340F0514